MKTQIDLNLFSGNYVGQQKLTLGCQDRITKWRVYLHLGQNSHTVANLLFKTTLIMRYYGSHCVLCWLLLVTLTHQGWRQLEVMVRAGASLSLIFSEIKVVHLWGKNCNVLPESQVG